MKILILGAGITGLSIGKLLHNKADVTILEKEPVIGGIARTRTVNGVAYHTVGGHCFNSKYPEVLDFVFSLLPKENWHLIQRLSMIDMGKYEVPYPIEFSVKEIFHHEPELAYRITADFLTANDDKNYENLEDWFRKKFGNALCDRYFIPYNTKIWGKNPREMDYQWVQDKLPLPDKQAFFKSLVDTNRDTMPHSAFYYPNTNNQNTLLEALAEGLNIKLNESVKEIKRDGNKWIINGIYEADKIISTLPLDLLPSYITDAPDAILEQSHLLKYNRVSNVLWESQPTDKTWTYRPASDTIFHRYIHIGSYFKPAANYTITECVGAHSFEEMVESGKKDPFLIRPISHNVSERAYVVFDENREKAVGSILEWLESNGIISIGRFGRWEYYNMDICIKQSMETARQLLETL